MKWSKLKKSAENLLATSLKGRIQYHVTRYGLDLYGDMTRAWITLDKEELIDFSTMEWLHNYYGIAHQIREINHCQDFRDESQREGYYASYEQAHEIMDRKSVYSRFEFYSALEEYLQLSIEDAMVSSNTIVRALSMLDRRLGKRRLRQMHVSGTGHPLVQAFYKLRCEAEDIKIIKQDNQQGRSR